MNDISKAYDAFTKCFGNRRYKQAFKCVLASLSKIPDDANIDVNKYPQEKCDCREISNTDHQ